MKLHIHLDGYGSQKKSKHPPHVEAARESLNVEHSEAGKRLKEVRERLIKQMAGGQEGVMGLTPEAVKTHPEFTAAKAAHEKAFETLRRFNTQYKP